MSINTSIWRPTWWNPAVHGAAWDLVKDSLRRDWEQTKHDLHLGGHELKQNAVRTLQQGLGAEPIPVDLAPNSSKADRGWHAVEAPYGYGHAARLEFGTLYPLWDPYIESRLRVDWLSTQHESADEWSDVVRFVRHGYEFKHEAP
jgi:hypothetical protein